MKRPVPLDAVEALRLYRAGPAAMFLPNTAQKSREINKFKRLPNTQAGSVRGKSYGIVADHTADIHLPKPTKHKR
jgi:hypothetical protein